MVLDSTKNDVQQNNSENKNEDENTDLDKSAKAMTSVGENPEQEPKMSPSTDDGLLEKKPAEDITLVLCAEEEGELGANTNEEQVKEELKVVTPVKIKRQKKELAKNVWVSNISRATKAAELKRLFSENFKVESAKIVTNGKSFFGYISLETAAMVQQSVKALNGFNLAGRIISVSIMRPDLKAGRTSAGEQVKRGKEKPTQSNLSESEKIKEKKLEDTNEISKETVKDSKDQMVEKKPDSQVVKTKANDKIRKHHRKETTPEKKDKLIQSLKKELDTANSELRITKRRLRDFNNRLEFERSKKLELIKDVSKLESELRLERRKVNQERELVEKKRKLDEMRYDNDRRILNKELDECKKLREYLQVRVDEMIADRGDRGRSPLRRSPPRRSYTRGREVSARGYGDMDKHQRSKALHISPPKQRDYEGAQCTAPSPPKITKRSPPRSHETSPVYQPSKKIRTDYTSRSYPLGPTGSTKMPLAHYPNSPNPTPKGNPSWNTSYKIPYRYSPTSAQGTFPILGSQVVHVPRFNSTRPLGSPNYQKRMPTGPRKY